ncbi:MAG: transposase [Bdellovibrionota bacterium]|nr:transposase [Bdellovibrionota bacterium]
METKSKKKTYTKELKNQAVERCKTEGLKKTSEDLGISPASLSNWKKLFNPSSSPSKSKEMPCYEELLKENKRLKKELSYVEEINDILKKSTAIFSNDKFRGSK